MKKFSLLMVLSLLMFSCADRDSIRQESVDSTQPTVIPDQIPDLPPNFQKTALVPAENPGDLIMNLSLPVSGYGVSVAVDCDGNIYYTLDDNSLYCMDKDGNLLSTTPIVTAGGQALRIDEFAWDASRELLWAQLHNSNPVEVYTIDPATGIATHAFQSQTISIGSYRDGIAYDGTDGTLWLSGDVSTTIEHYDADGTFLNRITPKNASGGDLGLISGVIVGVGDLLYLGRNGAVEIVQVKKSNGDFISSFASPGGARDEGLECDPVNFAPNLALWSREFYSPGFMSVILLEPGTCLCGGGLVVDLDIKPTSCPNPLNVGNGGLLPVAILGSEYLDVNEINLATVMLEGVSPVHSSVEDVTAPVSDAKDDCDCTTAGPDGYDDLTLKFDKKAISATLGEVSNGEIVVLEITGETIDGVAFDATDCVIIINKK